MVNFSSDERWAASIVAEAVVVSSTRGPVDPVGGSSVLNLLNRFRQFSGVSLVWPRGIGREAYTRFQSFFRSHPSWLSRVIADRRRAGLVVPAWKCEAVSAAGESAG